MNKLFGKFIISECQDAYLSWLSVGYDELPV